MNQSEFDELRKLIGTSEPPVLGRKGDLIPTLSKR